MKRAPLDSLLLAALSLAGGLLLTGCSKQNSVQINFQMGDRITAGPVAYNVIQTVWRTQLGDIFKTRVPENRFLMITLSATNGASQEVSVPLLTLEGDNGKEYHELENGDGIDNWFGLIRTLSPAETRRGNIVFDVPLTSYRLRLTDGSEPGTEKFVWVDIPLRIDTDTSIEVPGAAH
jgi:uncharacterized protein DUF4352